MVRADENRAREGLRAYFLGSKRPVIANFESFKRCVARSEIIGILYIVYDFFLVEIGNAVSG